MRHDGAGWRNDAVRGDGLYVEDERVVGARQDAISAPAGGTVIDLEARSTIGDILAMLRVHGMIAP
jgi:hypothetical protein